jgi:hypothetical protein
MMDDATVTTPKKGTKMATEKMDLQKLLAEVEKFNPRDFALFAVKANEIQEKKKKDLLKEIVQTFTSSLDAAGFSKQQGIEALGVKAASGTTVKSRPKAGKGGGVDIPREMWGKTFTNAATGETWTKSASGKGKPKAWLVDAINGGKTLAELLAK